jgi:hypothetical protein
VLKGMPVLKVKKELLAHKVELVLQVERVPLVQKDHKVLMALKVLKAHKVLLAHKVIKVKKVQLAQPVLKVE